jgi:hypothetical protein
VAPRRERGGGEGKGDRIVLRKRKRGEREGKRI